MERIERPFDAEDEEAAHALLAADRRGYAIGVVLVGAAALVLPVLGSAKTHGRAMVDQMPYAVAAGWVAAVGALILAAAYALGGRRLARDVRAARVLSWSGTASVVRARALVLVDGPARVREAPLPEGERPGDGTRIEVVVDYLPRSGRVLRTRRTSARLPVTPPG